MQREKICTGEMYHIYNRGVDKRIVFKNDDDYRYFIHLLYILNTHEGSRNYRRDYNRNKNKIQSQSQKENDTSTYFDKNHMEVGSTYFHNKRHTYVDILAFVLMPNHYHLLLKQNIDGGIAKFMQKLGTGYTMMFNEKYLRTGSLFQGRYKSVTMVTDEQLRYIPQYIHLNPLGKRVPVNSIESIEFLKKYRWSSFPDYIGIKNFPSVTSREFILSLYDGKENYLKSTNSLLATKDVLTHLDYKDCIDYQDDEQSVFIK